jgi:hypothetical protein
MVERMKPKGASFRWAAVENPHPMDYVKGRIVGTPRRHLF